MRMFPSITEPEYTKIIIDSSQGRRLLSNIQKNMDKITELHHKMIQ
jgi:hypothetical protein